MIASKSPQVSARGWLLRYVPVGIFLVISHHYLGSWYVFHRRSLYIRFIAFFLITLIWMLVPAIRSVIRSTTRARLLAAIFIIVFALPWGEWLQLAPPRAREDWSRQIFWNTCFIYGVFIFTQLLPSKADWIAVQWERVLNSLNRSDTYFRAFPILFFIFTWMVGFWIFMNIPLVQDSAAYLFQSNVFSSGKLFAPSPPNQEAFSYLGDMLVIHNEKWFSMYLPGYPVLLAIASMFRAEWLLSPLLGASVLGIWISYIRRWHNNRTALLFSVLFIFSPFLLLMYSTVMIYTVELFVVSSAIYLCRSEMEAHRGWRILALFAVCLFGFLTRPFSVVPFLAPVLCYTLFRQLQARQWRLPAAIIFGSVSGITAILFFNLLTTGHPLLSGYELEYQGAVSFGFGKALLSEVHTPLRGLENTSNNILGLNRWLTGWYSGALIFVILFILFGERLKQWDVLLVLSCFTLTVFYYFYVNQDLILGPRFLFSCSPVLLLFISRINEIQSKSWRVFAYNLLVFSFISFFPYRFHNFLHYYDPEGTVVHRLREEISKHPGKKLVFLDPRVDQNLVNWNNPFFRGSVVYSRDLKDENSKTMRAFPTHQPFYFTIQMNQQRLDVNRSFRLENHASEKQETISFFEAALAFETIDEHPEMDCFDFFYQRIFTDEGSIDVWNFLENELKFHASNDDYKTQFRLGLIHTMRFILLPRLVFESAGGAWKTSLNFDQLRQEFAQARSSLNSAGQIGITILSGLNKVQIRIDSNEDGTMSNEELERFLSMKLRF